jgi:hypothetical protein
MATKRCPETDKSFSTGILTDPPDVVQAMSLMERLDRKARNMGRMLKRLQIGPVALAFVNQGRLMASIVHTCQLCKTGEECEAWLKNSSAMIESAPAFCPNRTSFDLSKKMI